MFTFAVWYLTFSDEKLRRMKDMAWWDLAIICLIGWLQSTALCILGVEYA